MLNPTKLSPSADSKFLCVSPRSSASAVFIALRFIASHVSIYRGGVEERRDTQRFDFGLGTNLVTQVEQIELRILRNHKRMLKVWVKGRGRIGMRALACVLLLVTPEPKPAGPRM